VNMMYRFSAIVWVALVLASQAMGAEGLDPRKVSILYAGDPYPGMTPYLSMKEDAFTVVTPVQASFQHYAGISGKDIMKAMRIYMARSYEEYVNKYDVMILSDASFSVFSGGQTDWFANGVLDHGIGLIMVGGFESFGYGWESTKVHDVLPVSFQRYIWVSGYNRIEIVDFSNEFVASLPFRPTPEYMRVGTDGNYFTTKEGSSVLARWATKTLEFDNPPCYVTWTTGKGRTFALAHDWTPGGGAVMLRWEYYRDFVVNMMLYLAGKSIPDDPAVLHAYRENVHTLAISRSTLFSMIDFVESFGGSAREIEKEIGALDSLVADAKESYLNHEWEVALGKAQGAVTKMQDIEELSVRVKNQTLQWVYTIEWLSVTGVSLFAGVMLWVLMVRRKLYREVEATKFSQ